MLIMTSFSFPSHVLCFYIIHQSTRMRVTVLIVRAIRSGSNTSKHVLSLSWLQYTPPSRCIPIDQPDMEIWMSSVYQKTRVSTMLITSSTTCIIFLFSIISPLPSFQSFGLFTATVVLFDYVLVMTLFCTAVVIYHNQFKANSCFACSSTRPCNFFEDRVAPAAVRNCGVAIPLFAGMVVGWL
jgi:Sterol-sensing domain of SREBP cleavage-activation.